MIQPFSRSEPLPKKNRIHISSLSGRCLLGNYPFYPYFVPNGTFNSLIINIFIGNGFRFVNYRATKF